MIRRSSALLMSSSILAAVAGSSHAETLPQATQATQQSAPPIAPGSDSPANTNGDPATQPSDQSDIIVTATRRNEALSRVPASVSAFNQTSLDRQGLKAIGDVQRFTSNLQITRSGANGAANTNVSIRGISSGSGTATTGIYIDDTPIQVRRNGYTSRNVFPTLFDLDHLEVLRGPQGTLFGAGAEGGALRFITPSPSLTNFSMYSRAEVAATEHGAPSAEAGVAVGGPLIQDRLGFRLSGFIRRDGGYIDRVDFFTNQRTESNANYQVSKALRAALTWAPVDEVRITPSVLYNETYYNSTDGYWANSSNVSKGRFVDQNATTSPDREHFFLPALKIEATLGGVDLISNTAYFARTSHQLVDYTQVDVATGGFPKGVNYPEIPNLPDPDFQVDTQRNFTEEFRVQKANPDGFLNYTFGVFYSSAKQNDGQAEATGQLEKLYVKYYGLDFVGLFGVPAYQGLYSYVNQVNTVETQIAGFGQIDVRPTAKLTLTAGLRYTHGTLKYYELVDGPFAFPGGVTTGRQTYGPVTPKFGATYRTDQNNLFYANIAKGFRPGGVQALVPGVACRSSLTALGLTQSPTDYSPDSVWSYEAGAKNKLFGGRVRLDSSLFYIKWSNIQQTVPLSSCGVSFTSNLGAATSKGLDVAAALDVTRQLTLGLTLGYVDARFDQTERSGGTLIVAKDDRIARIPLTGSANAQYSFALNGRPGFLRGDFQFNGGGTTPNPLAQGYYPVPNLPVLHLLNLRAGMTFGRVNASIFLNNVFDATPQSFFLITKVSPILYGLTERPRTVGLTLSQSF